jgi:hypothetical protein
MKISSEQLEVLGEHTARQFFRQCAASLRERFPEQTSNLSEAQLLDKIEHLVDRLRSIGFECTGDLSRGVELMYGAQNRGVVLTMPEDLLAQLNDPHTSVETKIEALEQLSIFGGNR